MQWISRFSAPHQILTDNGWEFNNEDFQSMGENYNVKEMCTASESPWSNGICERLNAVLGDNVAEIISDSQCDVATALTWAVSTRNALQNNHGFSPNQLVYGFNPSIPNVFENQMPALESKTTLDVVANNFNAMKVAREAFIKNESNERIRRALLHNVRCDKLEDLQNGDEVFYKRNNEDTWRGPGVVIGKDGKQVLVQQGGTYVRAHICRLQVAPEPQHTHDEKDSTREDNPTKDTDEDGKTRVIVEDTESEEEEDTRDEDGAESADTCIKSKMPK